MTELTGKFPLPSGGVIYTAGFDPERVQARVDEMKVETKRPSFITLENVYSVPRHGQFFEESGLPAWHTFRDFNELLPAPEVWLGHFTTRMNKHKFIDVDEEAIYCGYLHRGWGHLLTDEVGRLWPLIANADEKRLRVLAAVLSPHPPWVVELLRLAGINIDRFTVFDRPVRYRRLIVGISTFQVSNHVYLYHNKFFETVIEQYKRDYGDFHVDDDIYISRSKMPAELRTIVNEAELEDLLRARGYRIVHPQDLTVPEQIAVFNTRGRIVGNVGSAMHSLLLRSHPGQIAILGRRATNPRCFMIDALRQNQTWYLSTNINFRNPKKAANVSETTIDQKVDIDKAESLLRLGGFL